MRPENWTQADLDRDEPTEEERLREALDLIERIAVDDEQCQASTLDRLSAILEVTRKALGKEQ